MFVRPSFALVSLPAAALVAQAFIAPASAQTSDFHPPRFERTQLADGVYAFVFDNALGPAVDGTAVVILNDDDVLVVDTQNTMWAARSVIAAIRELTNKPVRYVVNTHWHGDHHSGNLAYRQAYPGVEFIAHRHTATDIDSLSNPGVARFAAERGPKMLADGEQRLRDGKRADGRPMSAEERADQLREIELIRWLLVQNREYRPVSPTITVDREFVLQRGRRTIELKYLGRGNTRGDLVVWLPEERIVVTGDLLVNPVPYSFGSFLGEWIETLGAIRALEPRVIVPGHGAIQRDYGYLDQVVALLATTLDQVKHAVARGLDLEATRKAVNLDAIRVKFTNGERARENAFQAYFATPAVARAFLEARGELPPP